MYLIENGINKLIAKRIEIILSKDGPFDDIVMDLKSFTKANTEVFTFRINVKIKSRISLQSLGFKNAKKYHGRTRKYCEICSCFRCDHAGDYYSRSRKRLKEKDETFFCRYI